MKKTMLFALFTLGALLNFNNAKSWAAAPSGQDMVVAGGYEFYFAADPVMAAKVVSPVAAVPNPQPIVAVNFNSGSGWAIEAPYASTVNGAPYARSQTFVLDDGSLIVMPQMASGVFIHLDAVESGSSAVIITAEFRSTTNVVSLAAGFLNGAWGSNEGTAGYNIRQDGTAFQTWKRVVERFEPTKEKVTPFLQVASTVGLALQIRGEAGVQVRNVKVYLENQLTAEELVYLLRGTPPVQPQPTNTPIPTNTPVPSQPTATPTVTPTATPVPTSTPVLAEGVITFNSNGVIIIKNPTKYLDATALNNYNSGVKPKVVGDFLPGWIKGPEVTVNDDSWTVDLDDAPMPLGVNRFQIRIGNGWFQVENLPSDDKYNLIRETTQEDGGGLSFAVAKNATDDYSLTPYGTIVSDRSFD